MIKKYLIKFCKLIGMGFICIPFFLINMLTRLFGGYVQIFFMFSALAVAGYGCLRMISDKSCIWIVLLGFTLGVVLPIVWRGLNKLTEKMLMKFYQIYYTPVRQAEQNRRQEIPKNNKRQEEPKQNIPEKKAEPVFIDMFAGTSTADEVKKRYRDLSKVYHPDSNCGSRELFEELEKQYQKAMKGK